MERKIDVGAFSSVLITSSRQRGIRSAARDAGKLIRTYAIMGSNGVVITVGHRYRCVANG